LGAGRPFRLDHDAVLALGVRRHWAAGSTLFLAGERSDHVLLLESGRVKVASSAPSGRQVVLAIRGAGDLLGEFSAIDGRPRSATVTAISEVTAVQLSGAAFRRLLITDGATTFSLLRMVVERLREADIHRLEFGAYLSQQRIALLLLDYAERYGQQGEEAGVTISIALSQAELAQAVGASREAVTRTLKQLRDRGVVRTARRRIELLRPDVLRSLAEAPAEPED
jgi:CRP-like cAMP-binding protein